MGFCTKCGSKLREDSTFCSGCGNKIGTNSEQEVAISSNPDTGFEDKFNEIKKKVSLCNEDGYDDFTMQENMKIEAITKFCRVIQKQLGIVIEPSKVIAHFEGGIVGKGKRGFIIIEDGIAVYNNKEDYGYYTFGDFVNNPVIEEGSLYHKVIIYTTGKKVTLRIAGDDMVVAVHELIQLLAEHN